MKRIQLRKSIYTWLDVSDDFVISRGNPPDGYSPQLPEPLISSQLDEILENEKANSDPEYIIWAIDRVDVHGNCTTALWSEGECYEGP